MKKLSVSKKTGKSRPSDIDIQRTKQIKRMAKADAIHLRTPVLGAICGKG